MLGYEYGVVICLIVFPVHLQAGKANFGLSGVYIGTKRLSGVISEPKKPHFSTILAQNAIFSKQIGRFHPRNTL